MYLSAVVVRSYQGAVFIIHIFSDAAMKQSIVYIMWLTAWFVNDNYLHIWYYVEFLLTHL